MQCKLIADILPTEVKRQCLRLQGRQRGELRYLAPGHHDSTRGFVVLNGSHLSSIGVLLCKSEWEWASMATVDGGLRTLAIRSMGLSLGQVMIFILLRMIIQVLQVIAPLAIRMSFQPIVLMNTSSQDQWNSQNQSMKCFLAKDTS